MTIDEDLTWFLSQILDDNSVVFLEADHGMRYGDWYSSQEAFAESKLPVLFFIGPTAVLD